MAKRAKIVTMIVAEIERAAFLVSQMVKINVPKLAKRQVRYLLDLTREYAKLNKGESYAV